MPDYTEKKSLSRYNYGVVQQRHKGVTVSTSVGTNYFDTYRPLQTDAARYKFGRIPQHFENRPDVISYIFYGTPGYWWQIMMLNNFVDPFEQMGVGSRVVLPKN